GEPSPYRSHLALVEQAAPLCLQGDRAPELLRGLAGRGRVAGGAPVGNLDSIATEQPRGLVHRDPLVTALERLRNQRRSLRVGVAEVRRLLGRPLAPLDM